ncbi:MAG: hypothetical protein RLZZ360_245 [Candidatus Parcubacteria bacterium]
MGGESRPGAMRSENAGTSNRKTGGNPVRRNTKVSFAMVISEGLVGPKGIPNGGLDGEQVNIPAHWCVAMEGRRVVLDAAYWIAVGGSRRSRRQIRVAILRVQTKGEATAEPMSRSTLPRKTSKHKRIGSVPQSDTGGRVEKTKANE